MNVIVTGASRGIGLELTRLSLQNGHRTMAVARKPKDSAGLNDLKKDFGEKLHIVAVDLTDPTASAQIAKELGTWPAVDLLINNAGIMRQGITAEDFAQSFQVNSVVPFLMIKALTPWLKKSATAKAVNITSLMGSVADNKSGGYYAYRSSKAALNMINKSLAIDLSWLTTIVIHPGWVKTDMGGAGAPLEAKDSAKGIWKVITDAGAEQSGRFFNYTGAELPW